MVRLLIADANMLIRTGIRTILAKSLGAVKVSEAQTGAEVLASLRGRCWDLCVLDVSLPERGGLEILRHIRKGRYETKMLYRSSYADRQYAALALRLGASGIRFQGVLAGRTAGGGANRNGGAPLCQPAVVGPTDRAGQR